MVDPSGWALACYHEAVDENDAAREGNILAVLAGFAAEKHFREEHCYPVRDSMDVGLNRDNVVARTLLGRLAGDYALNEARLKHELQHLIERHWLPIEALAITLLAKGWEPLRPPRST